MNQTIPTELQSDHLFLLVGTNPLPDWVATRLLLRAGGQLYLAHSPETWGVAERLTHYLMANGYRQPEYIQVSNPYQAGSVFQAIAKRMEKITTGAVGLNYTGGTKVMATHGYQACREACRHTAPVFSYLEASSCIMRFDPLKGYPNGREFAVGHWPQTHIGLAGLFDLHEEYRPQKGDATPLGKAFFQPLVRIHANAKEHPLWREDVAKILRQGRKGGDMRPNLAGAQFRLDPKFAVLEQMFTPEGFSGTLTLGDVAANLSSEFTDIKEFAEWLDGKWLEHYVLHCLQEQQAACGITDLAVNVEAHRGRSKFEIDVAALRGGYQLHLLSCYSGYEYVYEIKKNAKLKLFEAAARAQQLGGEAARAALVSCADDPLVVKAVRDEVGELFSKTGQFEVFGRYHLLMLGKNLQKWFAKGAQENL